MSQVSKTFRVFVSSTFSDLKAERNVLQQYVFPRLRDLCRRHGCRFQAIDLRWGVRDEAALDQQTMKICLEEIVRCQRTSPRPNFIILLGDRYGWRPLPTEIPFKEFEQIKSTIEATEGLELLRTWYKLDENAIDRRSQQDEPQAVYCLQPREGSYIHFAKWEAVELRLRKVFSTALEKLSLASDHKLKFDSSATEQEIIKGAFQVADAGEHVFGFFRQITNLPELVKGLSKNKDARDFVDTDEFLNYDEPAHSKIDDLKKALTKVLQLNISFYDATWKENALTSDHLGSLPESLDDCLQLSDDNAGKLCFDVWKQLSTVIQGKISEFRVEDPLIREISEHQAFGAERSKSFVGRVRLLDEIEKHLAGNDPHALVITGDSGCGKSALLARAVERCQMLVPNARILTRFIGATPESSDGRALLESLCREISRAYNRDIEELPSDYKGLVSTFESQLGVASVEQPLCIFLDALDQLANGDQARNLLWIPAKLPPNASLVVSTLPDDCLRALESKLPAEKILTVEEMTIDEGEELLDRWLANANRRLQDSQRREVIEKFRACPLPLYLKLAFEEAKRWRSYQRPEPLSNDIEGMISALFQRLSDDANHGQTLVAQSLGLLAAAKNGLSEDEVLDVLSRSYTVFKDFLKRAHHKPPERRIPVVVWSRLFFDLEPYLMKRQADGAVLLGFYHRQLTTVARQLYLSGSDGIERHRALGRYFAARSLYQEHGGRKLADLRKLSELPHNQAHGKMWNEIQETLCNLTFLHAKANEGMVFDAINDFELTQSLLNQDHLVAAELKDRIGEFAIAFNQEFHAFQKRPLTAAQQIFNNLYVQSGTAGVAATQLQRFTADGRYPAAVWLRRGNVAPARSTSRNLLRTIAAHDGAVTAIATSPSGRFVASGGTDGRIHIWQQRDGSLVASLSGHENGVTGLAWLPAGNDESQLGSCGRDQQIRIWNWRHEHQTRQWRAHSDQIRALAAIPASGGAADLVSCGDDRVLKVWASATGQEVCTLRGNLDRVLCVTAGTNRHVYSGGEDRTLRSWRIEPPGEVRTFRGATDNVRSVAVDASNEWAVSGGDDLLLRIWQLNSNSERAAAGHRQRINCLGILSALPGSIETEPREPLIVSGSDDETVRLWNSRSAEELTTLFGHAGPVNVLVTDPAGRWICSGGEDGSLRVWSGGHSLSRERSIDHEARVNCLALASIKSPADSVVSASDDQTLKLWHRTDGALRTTLRGHSGAITSVLVPDSRHIVSSSADNTLKVWNQANGSLLRTLGATFDPSAVTTGRPTANRVGHTSAVTCLALAGEGVCLSGGRDSTVRLWNFEKGEELRKFTGARGVIENVLVDEDMRWVVAIGSAPQVAVWDLNSDTQPQILSGHTSRVSCAAWGPGEQLVTGSLDKTVRIWNFHTNQPPTCFSGHSDWVTCVAFDPEGRVVVSGGRDSRVIIWRVGSGESVQLTGHTDCVRGVFVDADERRIISFADDQWLIVWDLDDGREIAAVHLDSPISSLLLAGRDEFWLGTRRGGIGLLHLEHTLSVEAGTETKETRERAA